MSNGAWKLKIDPPASSADLPMWRGTMTMPDMQSLTVLFGQSRADLIADARKFKHEYLNPPPLDVVDI